MNTLQIGLIQGNLRCFGTNCNMSRNTRFLCYFFLLKYSSVLYFMLFPSLLWPRGGGAAESLTKVNMIHLLFFLNLLHLSLFAFCMYIYICMYNIIILIKFSTLRERKNLPTFIWGKLKTWLAKQILHLVPSKEYLFCPVIIVYFCHELTIQRGKGTIKAVIKCHFQNNLIFCRKYKILKYQSVPLSKLS